jgi:hypothetical protein
MSFTIVRFPLARILQAILLARPRSVIRLVSQGAAMMSTSKHVATFALPTSSNVYGWNSLDREEIAFVHDSDDMIENHWKGDEGDL